MKSTRLSNFSGLLPHQPPMLMLTRLMTQDTDNIHCSSVIDEHNPLLRDGLFPCTGGLELLAQAAGLLFAAHSSGNAVRPGAIVQVKSFRIKPAVIPVGAELHIHAHYRAGNADAALFEGEVTFNEQHIFTGSLMIALLPEESR